MKKFIAMVLTLAMLFALTAPAFAATQDDVLVYSLEAQNTTKSTNSTLKGENNVIYAQKDDVITISCYVTADIADSWKGIETGQDQILYDTTFFELVPNSNQSASTSVQTSTPSESELLKYVYFNWTSTLNVNKNEPKKLGSFQLKVIGTGGSGMVTNNAYKAEDGSHVEYGKSKIDLKVIYGTGPVAVTGVSIDETASLNVGDEKTLTATITPNDATNTNVTWESSDTSVATVGTDGKVTAVAEGTATITVTTEDGNKSASCVVTVSKKTPTVTGTLTADVTYGDTVNASAIDATGVTVMDGENTVEGTWAWKDTVTSYGNAAAEAKQLAAVFTPTNTAKYSAIEANVSVTVGKATLTPAVASVADKQYDGDTTGTGTLSLTGAKNSEVPTASGTFTWTAADAGTSTVNVTGITLGTDWQTNYQLSVTSLDNQSANKSISKANQNPSVTATATLTRGGNTLDLSTLVTDAVGAVTFTIASGDAATLSGTTLTSDATKTGEVKITVKAAGNTNYNEYTGTSAITVTVQDKADAGVTITNAPESRTYGDENFTVSATVSNAGTNGTWTWTSSDESILKIVSDGDTNTVTVQVVSANTTGATLSAKYESDTTADTETTAAIPVAQKTLTITGVAATDRDYAAGNTTVTLTGGTLQGVVGSDNVGFTLGTGTIEGANAAEGKSVTTNITLTGDDEENYTLTQPTGITVTIRQLDPTYTVPTELSALPSDTLADVTLPTGWTWKDAGTTSVGDIGSNNFTAVFTPDDTTNYKTVEKTVSVAVAKGTPTVQTAPTATAVTYGDTVSDAVLSGGTVKYGDETLEGTWAWKSDVESYGNATNGTPNTLKATFTPTNSDRYESVDADVNVTVNKATPEYEAPTGLTATYGQTLANVDIASGNGTGTGAWSWMNSTTSVGDASDSAKTFNAKFTPSDTANYNTVENINVSVTVNKATQNPGITATATLTKGGNTLDLSTLVTSGTYYGALTFEITSGEAAALEDGSTLTSTENLGTVKIVVMADGDNNHESYTSANDAITVTVVDKADAGVNFTGTVPTSKTYGDADFTLTADKTTAGTGTGIWTWSSSNTSVLTVDDSGKVKVIGAGNATITAKFESSTTVGTASQNITVAPLPVTLGWYTDSAFTTPYTDNSFTYDSTEKAVYAKVTNAVGTDAVTVSAMTGNTATNANASGTTNTAEATALGGDDAANYTLTGATATKSWKIAPRSISGATITLGTALTYTGSEQTQTVTDVTLADPSLTLTSGTDYTVSGNKGTTVKTNGDYTLTVTGTGNFTGTATKAWNIAKATDNAISDLAISDWTYDSSTNTPNSTAKYGTPTYTYYTDEGCATETSTADGASAAGGVPANAGTYYVKADVAETANYNAASDKTSFTIAKADYVTTGITGKTIKVYFGKTDATTVTVEDINGTLPAGAAIKSVAESADTNEIIGTITGAEFSLDQEPVLTNAAVGKTATLTVTVGSTNYNDFDVSVTVELIGKVDVGDKMTLGIPESVTYGSSYTITGKLNGTPTAFAYSYRVSGSTGEYTSGLPTDAGTYEIMAEYEDDTPESGAPGHIGAKTGTLTVAPKTLTITGVTATARDYAADNTTVVLVSTSAALQGVVTGDDVELDSTSAAGTVANANAAQNKAVTVTGFALSGDDAANYTLTQPTDVKVTINKATPTYEAPAGLTATYGQTLANVELSNGWSWMNSNTSVGDASTTPATFKAKYTPNDTNNYKIVEDIDVSVTVNKAAQSPSITADATLTKGGNTLDLSTLVTANTYYGTLSFTILSGSSYATLEGSTLTSTANSGDVTIKVQAAGDANHEAYDSETAAITVTVTDKTAKTLTGVAQQGCTYGGTLADPSYTAPTGTTSATVTYAGTTRGGSAYGPSADKPIDAGTYTATVKCETATEIYTSAPVSFSIAPKSITGATVTLGTALTYTGSEQNQTVSKVELGGTDITSSCDVSDNARTDAGSQSLTVTAKDTSNYTGSVQKQFAVAKKPITPTIEVTGTYSFAGSAITPTYTVKDGGTALASTDYSAALSDNTNVGNGKITVTEKTGGNYTFNAAEQTFTISKADAKTIADQNVSQKYTVTTEQSKSVAGLMPTDAGTLTYTKGSESKNGAVTVSSWNVSDAGLVTFTLTGGAAGNTVTLPVTITSTNYADSTVKVVITLTEKDTPTASASNYTATYTGSPVDVSAITKTASVPGTWAWKDGTQVTNVADSGVKTLVFTPNDTENYESVETSVTVTINKAKPTGIPGYTRITGSGKTLADAALTVGTITPAGTITWDMPATTSVNANTSYAWTFAPTDSANYDTLTGTVTLWTQGGGDPGIITPPSPQTVTVPVSGDDETIRADVTISGTEAKLKIDTSKLNTVVHEDVKTGTVEIDLTELDKNIASVVVPNSALKDITAAAVDPDNDTDSLALMLTDGTIKFDEKALESIAKQAGSSDLKLVVDDTGVKDLKTAQVQALQDNTVLAVYDIYMTSNGKRITNFEGGTAEVTVRHKLAAGQKTEGLVVLYVADDGSKTSMPFVIEGNEVVFTVTHFSNYVITYDEDVAGYKLCPQDETCVYAKFTDADTKAWYHPGVHFCVENGYMQGVSLTEFDPAGTTTRAMIVTILWRMEGSPVANYAMSFKDVKANQWYTEAIRWAQSTGVVEGYSDDAFGPEDVITREQLATILYRYAGYKGIDVSARSALAGFEDTSSISGWALDYVKWAVAVGMINGRTDTTIVPKGDATRAEAACMIQRFCETILKK